MVIAITNAQYLGNYKIELSFSDDTIQEIDFKQFLEKSKNPMTRKFLNEDKFRKFTILHGDLVWNDFELCFPIWDLHEGQL